MVASGIAGVDVEVGDHICAFYEGRAERDALLAPFLETGLLCGDKCLAVLDTTDPVEFESRLAVGHGHGDLTLVRSEDAYLVDGRFETQRMLEFWRSHVGAAVSVEGFPLVRAAGEMTWSLRDAPGVDELIGYESLLNDFLPSYPQIILCLYDVSVFDAATVIGMMRTHPKVILGGELVANPYYLPPEEFLGAGRAR